MDEKAEHCEQYKLSDEKILKYSYYRPEQIDHSEVLWCFEGKDFPMFMQWIRDQKNKCEQ